MYSNLKGKKGEAELTEHHGPRGATDQWDERGIIGNPGPSGNKGEKGDIGPLGFNGTNGVPGRPYHF